MASAFCATSIGATPQSLPQCETAEETSRHRNTARIEIAATRLRLSAFTRKRSLVGVGADRHHHRRGTKERTLARPRALVIGGSVGGCLPPICCGERLGGGGVRARRGRLGDRGTGIGTREELFAVMRRIGLSVDASIGIDVAGASGPRPRRRRHPRDCRSAPSPAPGRASGARCGKRCRMPATQRQGGHADRAAGRRRRARSSMTARAPRAISWSRPTDCIPRFARSTFPSSCRAMPVTWPGAAWSRRKSFRPSFTT